MILKIGERAVVANGYEVVLVEMGGVGVGAPCGTGVTFLLILDAEQGTSRRISAFPRVRRKSFTLDFRIMNSGCGDALCQQRRISLGIPR